MPPSILLATTLLACCGGDVEVTDTVPVTPGFGYALFVGVDSRPWIEITHRRGVDGRDWRYYVVPIAATPNEAAVRAFARMFVDRGPGPCGPFESGRDALE